MPRKSRGAHLQWRADRRVWQIITYQDGIRCVRSTGTSDRSLAEEILAQAIIEQRRPIGPSRPSERLVTEVLAGYATERAPHTADPERIGHAIQALVPFWTDQTVAEIREPICRRYARERGVSQGTARRELGTLRAAVRWDYRQGRLTEAPHVWLPPKPEGKDRWLTRSEAARLLWAARRMHHLALFILIGLYTGARKEAVLSLRWAQVDLDRELIDFNPPGRQRTKKDRPIIRVPRRLMTFLRYARRHGTPTGFVVQYKGGPIASIKTSWRKAVTTAGLKDVTPHTLRHTAASWLAQAGVPFAQIAAYLGHRDSRTTEQTYAHHSPDYHRAAVSALDRRKR